MEVAECSATQKVNPLTVKLDILTLLSRHVTAKLQYSICLFPYFSIKGTEFGPLVYTSSTWNEKFKLTLNSWAWITFPSAFGNTWRLLPSPSPKVPPCWPLSPPRLWQGHSPLMPWIILLLLSPSSPSPVLALGSASIQLPKSCPTAMQLSQGFIFDRHRVHVSFQEQTKSTAWIMNMQIIFSLADSQVN